MFCLMASIYHLIKSKKTCCDGHRREKTKSSKGDFFRVKVKGQRSQATSGSFFVLIFFRVDHFRIFFRVDHFRFFFRVDHFRFLFRVDPFRFFFRVDPFRIFFRGGHSLAYFVNIHEKGGVIMNSNEAVDWQVPSEWKRRLWIGNEKMFRAFDVTEIENLFLRKWSVKEIE